MLWALTCGVGTLVSLALLVYFGPGDDPYSSEGGEAVVVVSGAALSALAAGLAGWAVVEPDERAPLRASVACAVICLTLWTFA